MRNPVIVYCLVVLGFTGSVFAGGDQNRAKKRVTDRFEVVFFGPTQTTTGTLKTGADALCGDKKSLGELGSKHAQYLGNAVQEARDRGVKPDEPIYVGFITWKHNDGLVGEPSFKMYLAARKIIPPSAVKPKKDVEALQKAQLVEYVQGLSREGLNKSLPQVDQPTLQAALMNVDNDTLIEALENVDRATLQVALKSCLDDKKLKYGLINIDEPTLQVACEVMDKKTYEKGVKLVDEPTKVLMIKHRPK
ncbi:MAG: hypothetical protein V4719_21630 [Planctomycetota bacterium]